MAKLAQASTVDVPAAPRHASQVVERVVDGELVLYDSERQYVHALNATAAFIWQACEGSRGAADIAAALAERYPQQSGEIEEDVARTLQMFAADRLIEG